MKYWTLRGGAKRELSEHCRSNELFGAYKISLLRRILRMTIQHPLLSAFVAMGLYIFVLLVAGTGVLDFVYPVARDADSVLGDLTLTVMAAQAAILGIVYPLVIGLVSVFFAGEHARKTRISVFLSEAEVKPLGYSGFLLLFFIASQGLILDRVNDPTYLSFSLLNVIWFSGNLFGAGFFLWTTHLFLLPEERIGLLKRHTVNVTWKLEMMRRMMQLIWVASADSKYEILPNVSTKGVDLSVGTLMGEKGDTVVAKTFSKPRNLDNVRFWLLRPMISLWCKREGDPIIEDDGSGNEYDVISLKPSLIFPLMPGDFYPKESNIGELIPILKIQNSTILKNRVPVWEWWLVWLSFKFVRQNWHKSSLQATSTLNELT